MPIGRLHWRDRSRMILSSAASAWACLVPKGEGRRLRPRAPLLSTADFSTRRARAALNGSLTIIVLTPLTTFSASAFTRVWKVVGKRMNSLGYFYRDGGASKGPPQARDRLTRCLVMPCADRVREDIGPGADPHPRSVPPAARRLPDGAEFAAAQDWRQDRRSHRRPHRSRQRPKTSRQGQG